MGVLPDWMIERDVKIEPFSPQQHRPGVISYGVTSYGYDVRAGYKWRVFDVLGGGTVIDPKNFDPKLLREIDLTPNGAHIIHKDEFHGTYHCGRCGHPMKVGGDIVEPPCPMSKPDHVVIPPNSYALGESFETFTIPRDVVCVCVGKSTYARCGIIVNVTPGEPEWTGRWTIEISNSTPLPAKVYCGEGLMQCVFIRTDGREEAIIRHLGQLTGMQSADWAESMLKQWINDWMASSAPPLMNLWLDHDATCRVSYKDKKGKYQAQTGITNPIVEKS